MDKVELKVLKRDGSLVPYEEDKIFNAILNAFTKVGYLEGTGKEGLNQVMQQIMDIVEGITISLEDDEQLISRVDYIQELVKDELLLSDYNDVAKEYITYSAKRDALREDALDMRKSVGKVVSLDKDTVNENANKDSRKMATRGDLTRGQVSKSEGLKMLPKEVRNAHLKGILHFHEQIVALVSNY